MAASCLTFVGYFRLVVPSIKDIFNTLIAGSGRKGERFPAGGFQPVGRIFVSQLQKPHTAAVGLLFYTLGGKDCINYLMGVDCQVKLTHFFVEFCPTLVTDKAEY